MILVVDNYDSFTFNLYQMLQERSEDEVVVKRNDALSLREVEALKPRRIVLSPGPGHPGNAGDFGVCAQIVAQAGQLNCPVLGVCLGHQGIAHYLGGRVERAPYIVHGKTSDINIVKESPLFAGLPREFKAMRYHSLIVEESTMPACLTVTARDAKTQLVMALQHTKLPLYGLQFHPESIGTPLGAKILENFLSLC